MKTRPVLVFVFACFSLPLFAQQAGFSFGQVTYRELEMKTYDKDTTAAAAVLNEFGEAYLSSDEPYNLIFKYHVKIKIFNKNGLHHANIEIPLRKSEGKEEFVRNLQAASYNIENGSMRPVPLDPRQVFTEDAGKWYNLRKFAVPNVREGSVIEYQYEIHSPFLYNFRRWQFQSDIPKLRSEYWALIPGNYLYNISLRGFLNLKVNENSIVKDCFSPGGRSADCALYKWAMTDVPAFIEEDYMTAPSNFISAINFELSEIRYFDGRVDKVTKEWRDAELELKKHSDFGPQLRKGKDIISKHPQLEQAKDELERARGIYTFVQQWFQWNGSYGMLSDVGVKKAYDTKQGNVADINLSLVAALREAGLEADPVILSTRNNGLPVELYPVLSDFNYVIARVVIAGKTYLLDATDRFFPFGLLPEHCLNGKGRVMAEKSSEWIELVPGDKSKQVSVADLTLDEQGIMRGTIMTTYTGYEAVEARKRLSRFHSEEDYIADLDASLPSATITGHTLTNADDINAPFVQTLNVEIHAFDGLETDNLLLNPNLLKKWNSNPFKSSQRVYPVDFGMPIDITTVINIAMPDGFELVSRPEDAALSLPNNGGRYYFEFKFTDGRLTASNALMLYKRVYSSQEYRFLKALFSTMLQKQNEDLVFKRKT